MIFVTYGTQPHDFKYLGEVVNQIDEKYPVIVQLGESSNNIIRKNVEIYKYMDNFKNYVENCDILITHGGVGSIMDGLKLGKCVIAVSRLSDFNEHVDNHQLEITNKLAQDGYIYHLKRNEDINQVIERIENMDFKAYQSNTKNFVSNIEVILRGEK